MRRDGDRGRGPGPGAWLLLPAAGALAGLLLAPAGDVARAQEEPAAVQPRGDLATQPAEEADRKSKGCLAADCHVGIEPMHVNPAVRLGCTDCHGGNAEVETIEEGHVQPRYPDRWLSGSNPPRTYSLLNREDPAFVRFMNPGDLRAAPASCGAAGCHVREVERVQSSMMTTGAMLWGAALYNNGAFPFKDYWFGESYTPDGKPRRIYSDPYPTPEETRTKGVLPFLDPLPRFEITQPGNVLRVFERGGKFLPEPGQPILEEEPGRPDPRLSIRGFGTLLRTDPVFLGLQKTRLLDPMLSFLGTNDHPGDYRSSGCTACHVVYANDRDPYNAGPYAKYGNRGHGFSDDPTQPKGKSGHPIRHRLTSAIPTSTCMVCHMHQGAAFVNGYVGATWWDQETDGRLMYPAEAKELSPGERREILNANPEEASLKGRWSEPEFLAEVSRLNPRMRGTQFADYHGHGWVFRNVYKQDRYGNLLDPNGERIPDDARDKFDRAVHLKDIHLEGGMHCVDCHFHQDVHGDGRLYGEVRNAVEIDCRDCHGTTTTRANLTTSGPASAGGHILTPLSTPSGRRRFIEIDGKIFQRSMVDPNLEWEVVQVMDTLDPESDNYNARSRYAKTLRTDGQVWGDVPADESILAHRDQEMTCYACHSSWVTACFGCHIPMKANERTPMLHNEGKMLRNWTSYNPQVVRDEVYILARDGTVTGRRIAPVRSSSAVVVSSQNQNRDWLYYQQQTIGAEGYSGQVFNTHVPHTVRSRETKGCTDCHVSAREDNNAIMAQVLGLGANGVNFMGRRLWVAEGKHGIEAVAVTELGEPPAVIGSELHELAWPDEFREHLERGRELKVAEHHGAKNARSITLRGEYVYTADGPGGLMIYDVANIENKAFSEKIVTAPVSPLGQNTRVRTKWATAVASPTTMGVDPARTRDPRNEEQPIHMMYAYLYVTDMEEGLILVNVATLLDGDPRNNFLERAVTYNPGGELNGAVNLAVAGHYVYVLCEQGIVVVSVEEPLSPRIVGRLGKPHVSNPRSLEVQFRYAFVVDDEGLKVLDVTDMETPKPVPEALVPFRDARSIYVVRNWVFVAAGGQGMGIVDIERPREPKLMTLFDAGGAMDDVNDVKVAMTNVSYYAYVADGHNGIRVLQLTSPSKTPGHYGYMPPLTPALIASYQTHGEALAISEGLDRDRAVDETGHQLAGFGRRGARPFTRAEMEKFFMRFGRLYKVEEGPETRPRPFEIRSRD